MKWKGYQKYWAGMLGLLLQGVNAGAGLELALPAELVGSIATGLAFATALAVRFVENR